MDFDQKRYAIRKIYYKKRNGQNWDVRVAWERCNATLAEIRHFPNAFRIRDMDGLVHWKKTWIPLENIENGYYLVRKNKRDFDNIPEVFEE